MFNLNFLYLEGCYCKKIILWRTLYVFTNHCIKFFYQNYFSWSLLQRKYHCSNSFIFCQNIILLNISDYFSLINHNTCIFLLPGSKKSLKFNPCILLMYSQNCCNLHMHEQLMTYFINHFMLPKNLDPCTWFMHACSTKFSKGLYNVSLSITESLAKKIIKYILSPNKSE